MKFAAVKQAVTQLEDFEVTEASSAKYDTLQINRLAEQLYAALDGGELPDALIDELRLKLRGHVNDEQLNDFVSAVNFFDFKRARIALTECLETLGENKENK